MLDKLIECFDEQVILQQFILCFCLNYSEKGDCPANLVYIETRGPLVTRTDREGPNVSAKKKSGLSCIDVYRCMTGRRGGYIVCGLRQRNVHDVYIFAALLPLLSKPSFRFRTKISVYIPNWHSCFFYEARVHSKPEVYTHNFRNVNLCYVSVHQLSRNVWCC